MQIPADKIFLIGAQAGDSVAVTPRAKAAAEGDSTAARKTIAA